MLKLRKYLWPYRYRLALMILMLFLQVFGTLYLPTLTAEIVNNGVLKGNIEFVWKAGKIMLAVAVATAVISLLETYLSITSFSAMGRDLRNDLFGKAQNLPVSEFNGFGPASMITRCTHDINRVQDAYMEAIEMLLPAPVMSVAGLVLAFRKNPSLAMLIVAAMAVICILMYIVNDKAIKVFDRLQAMLDGINRILREILTGIRDIRAYNRDLYEQERTNQVFNDYSALALRVGRLFAAMFPMIMTVMNICTILIIIAGGNSVAAGSMEIGDIMAMIEYAALILMYLTSGVFVFMDMPQAQTCARRISEVLDCRIEETSAGTAIHNSVFEEKINRLVFRNVTFRYEDADAAVLKDISFTAKAGETTAIIGGTGTGKTTLVSLIPRLFDVNDGEILLNDTDIRKIPLESLRKHIGFVPQKSYLFAGKIKDIFLSGKEDASEKDMHRAAEIAQISEFIDGLKDGFETEVSQGGTNFSGGQRQRFAIARALVRKPGIFIFDDSFSALDFKTDALLRASLNREAADAVVITVAQRISTIMHADQIIVLDKGTIAGIGTHRELLKNCSTYIQIARSQLREEELYE